MGAGILSAPGISPGVVFNGFFTDTANNSSDRTFSDVPIGNPSADRIVIAFIYQSRNITSPALGDCTLGGVDASAVGFASQAVGGSPCSLSAFFWDDYSASVNEADIVFSPAGTTDGVGISVFTLYRSSGALSSTTTFVFDPNTAGANTDDLTLNIEDNGIIVGAMYSREGTATGQLGGLAMTSVDEEVSANGYYAWAGWERTFETDASKAVTMNGFGDSWVGVAQPYGSE